MLQEITNFFVFFYPDSAQTIDASNKERKMQMNKRKFSRKNINHPRVIRAVAAYRNEANENSDVLGWYTGKPSKKSEVVPEQDQDDI